MSLDRKRTVEMYMGRSVILLDGVDWCDGGDVEGVLGVGTEAVLTGVRDLEACGAGPSPQKSARGISGNGIQRQGA